MTDIQLNGDVTSDEINNLMDLVIPGRDHDNFTETLKRSLGYVVVRDKTGTLIGYCNLAWDGGRHATIFDLNVHPDHRNQDFVFSMLQKLVEGARNTPDLRYLHADFNKSRTKIAEKYGFEIIHGAIMYL